MSINFWFCFFVFCLKSGGCFWWVWCGRRNPIRQDSQEKKVLLSYPRCNLFVKGCMGKKIYFLNLKMVVDI